MYCRAEHINEEYNQSKSSKNPSNPCILSSNKFLHRKRYSFITLLAGFILCLSFQ